VLRASAVAERLGIPTVSLVSSGFQQQAGAIAKGIGLSLPIAVYPGHPMVDTVEEVVAKTDAHLLQAVIDGLAAPRNAPLAIVAGEPEPGSVVFRGTLAAVQEHFLERLWSDGLPIIPPTRALVDDFLSWSPLPADTILGVLAQEEREATVLSVAINAVMAGCRPEYMPVLIAVVEAIADPEFRIEDAGSTPSWEPLIVVSGPLARQLDFNVGQGVMKMGRQANASIGRFLRLYLRNVAGYRIAPGDGDKGSIGFTFNVALAEDEETTRRLGWPTFGEDRGFAPQANAVSVMSVVCISAPCYSAGSDAVSHARQFAALLGRSFAPWAFTGLRKGKWHPLLIVSPAVAAVIAREWSKDQLRDYFWRHTTLERRMHEEFALPATGMPIDFKALVAAGILPPHYADSDDPEAPLRLIVKPEHICIVVAGDPGRNQTRGYMANHNQGSLTSKPITLPGDWEQRIAGR